MDFLKEEGYVPKIDDDGDVLFKYQGDKYFISIDEEDTQYFRMFFLGDWECENDGEKARLFKAASDTNYEMKIAKTFIINDTTIVVIIECLLNDEKDFKINLARWLDVITSAIDTFNEKMKAE
jgi:hypothetical protein